MSDGLSTPAHQAAKYTIGDSDMAQGSTLGSARATLIIKATGALEKMYSPEIGTDVFGTVVFHHWDAETGVPLTPRPGTFEIYPEHQRHNFQLSNGVDVRENIFMISSTPQGEDRRTVDPPGAYYTVELHNNSGHDVHVGSYASVKLRGGFTGKTRSRYDGRIRGFVVSGGKEGDDVRIAACEPAPDGVEVTHDSAKANATAYPGELAGERELETIAEPIGIFQFQRKLGPGKMASFCIMLTFAESEDAARAALADLPDAKTAFERTRDYYESVLGNAIVVTPENEVNRGAIWAKANILRVQNLTGQGWCFVNDPTRSNNSVGRDTAWYARGADYLTPGFTREALLWYLEHTETGAKEGMVVEYFDIRNGQSEDYGLNINDDTPLLIIALWHHYCVTGDRQFLEYVWPRAQAPAKYILSQRNERGLVWCTAEGTADWGMIGWRNIVPGYRLSGATTEVNSECYAALYTMSQMARELGDAQAEAQYRAHAEDLKTAINEHLLDKSRNLYYLNIDLDGTPRTDVTCDLVFPVLFGIADREVASNIVSRLSSQEFWSDAGMHTVPRTDINYSPTNGDGLFGGIWSGPTFWFATAAADFNQEFMAYALTASFRHYTTDPRRNNTVPGQFCEWLHGETLTNQGMMLSPWFAPKYLWSALEGAAGLNITAQTPSVKPRMASAWSWIGARNVMVRGKRAMWLCTRFNGEHAVFGTYPFSEIQAENLYEEDITHEVEIRGDTAVCMAMRRRDGLLLFVGNTLDRTINVGISCAPERGRYVMRGFNTLRNEWIEKDEFDIARFARGMPIEVSRHGFALIELHKEV